MAIINAFAEDAVDRAESPTVTAAYAQCRDAALAESVIGAIGLEIESHLVDLDHVADPVPWQSVEAIAGAAVRLAPGTAGDRRAQPGRSSYPGAGRRSRPGGRPCGSTRGRVTAPWNSTSRPPAGHRTGGA